MRLAIALVLLLCSPAYAQHEHHHPPSEPEDEAEDDHHSKEHHHDMTGVLGLPMNRDASGTAWQPDATPMRGVHLMAGDFMVMLHWSAFVGYVATSGPRGGDQVMSTNWVMAMGRTPLGGGQLDLRTMLSFEPLTVPGEGYPLLLQTGETYEGHLLHDTQHPHDLFMEVGATYARPITDDLAWQIYLAPSGEPALGPIAFPHRASAAADPLATLSHHWQDSTHISFGVITAGLFTRTLKLEGSWFNGREPDEHRYGIDLRRPDAASGRLWYSPTPNLAMQTSYGYLDSPEDHDPTVSIQRVTASVSYDLRFSHGNLAALASFGLNHPSQGPTTDSYLLEADLTLGDHDLFGRFELIQKTGHDLDLPEPTHDSEFRMASISLGYLYSLGPFGPVLPGLGVRGTLDVLGPTLEPYYGSRTPIGGLVYLRIAPAELP